MIDLDAIHRGMTVMTSDHQRLGTVRDIQGRVTRLDDAAGAVPGGFASVPLEWILSVDDAVYLAKSREQAERELTSRPFGSARGTGGLARRHVLCSDVAGEPSRGA